MNTHKVFLFLLAVLLLLGAVTLLFPKDGIELFGISVRMPSIEELFFTQEKKYADINAIVSTASEKKEETAKDSIVCFEYKTEVRPLLDKFFAALDAAKRREGVVRILHYGDSQIENDHISSDIRRGLQAEFGGSGYGQIPLYSLSDANGVKLTYNSEWKKQNTFSRTQSEPYPLALSRLVAENDSTDGAPFEVGVTFARKPTSKLAFLLRSPQRESFLRVSTANGEPIDVSVAQSEDLQRIEIPVERLSRSFTLEVGKGVELYSMNISQPYGVYVDNIPVRGRSSMGIRASDVGLMRQMADSLGVKMVIIQFGVNAVQGIERANYNSYKRELESQIRYLKQIVPDVLIVIVGVSDSSKKKGVGYETNPNVFKLIEVQRAVALENGCVFWNLFQAMGGNNSMPSWVEKSLAKKDYVHFNAKGAQLVAKMFLDALTREYK